MTVVDDNAMKRWDAIWHQINEEFECEIRSRDELCFLSGKMFYVWEGNHRTVAWMAAITERFVNTRAKHCRVLCTLIDPTRVSEIALLSSFQ